MAQNANNILSRYTILLFIVLFMTACIKTPNSPDNPNLTDAHTIILCEGLMGYNNASISILDLDSMAIQNNYFKQSNPNLILGDVANDIAILDGKAIVTVTGSGTIESFDINTGAWSKRIVIEGSSINKTTILNDSIAYATDLYNDSTIIQYNPTTMELLPEIAFTGKNPVEIISDGSKIFVANSGLGIYFQNHKEAGMLSIIDIATQIHEKNIYIGPNLSEILKIGDLLYLCYYNTYSADAKGGIVELRISDLTETNRIEGFFSSITYDKNSKRLYFLEGVSGMDISDWKGVSYIDLNNAKWYSNRLIENTKENDNWYCLSIDKSKEHLLVGNAKNFMVEGGIEIFDMQGSHIKSLSTGVIPTEIVNY